MIFGSPLILISLRLMRAVTYYLLYPFIQIVARSPFWLLYLISDFLYFLFYRLIGYRKQVILENLTNSFPEKSEKEIKAIASDFYRYLCDLILETLKTISWDENHVRARTKFNNVELMNRLYKENKSIIIVMGHLGNWEWAGPCFSLNCEHQLNVVYLPLTNPYFEKLLVKTRTKFNTQITPRNNTLRAIVANRKIVSATALIADQAPAPINTAHWMDFLNQDTPVYKGPEKIAVKMNYPVVYMKVDRVKRGFYEVTPELINEKPNDSRELEITKAFNKMLEKDIIAKPETWLWSHKRWKHKRN